VVHRVGGKERIEFPIGKVLYETAEEIGSMRFSPRGDRIALTDSAGTVATVDMAGKARVLSSGWGYAEVAWRPDGREVWFSGYRRGEKFGLYAVTLSGRERMLRRESAGLYLHDVSRDGRVLFNEYVWTSSLAALRAGESAERDLSWMDFSLVADISDDGRFVTFSEQMEGGGARGAVYLRATDGSPAVRLSEGSGLAISPDGQWVLSKQPGPSEPLVLLPTGPGQPRPLEHLGVAGGGWGRFFPGGKRVSFYGRSGSGGWRLYVHDLEGGATRPISPEGMPIEAFAISPDGRSVAAQGPDGKISMFPVDGGPARLLSGAAAGESPILWSADGGSLYVFKAEEAPAEVFRVDIATGRRDLWKTIAPSDRSGLVQIDTLVMTPDAHSYAYSYERILTELEIMEGLR
jgi:Tol biopolymer transport system component